MGIRPPSLPAVALAVVAGGGLVFTLQRLPDAAMLAALALAALLALHRGHALTAAMVLGTLVTLIAAERRLADDWPCSRDRETLRFTGTVIEPPVHRPGRVDLELGPDAAGRAAGLPSRVRLSWYEPTATPLPGERWVMPVRLRCRSGLANPGGFDRELQLLRDGIGATGHVTSGEAPRRVGGSAWSAPLAALRAWTGMQIATATADTRSGGVLQGLAVGLRATIPDDLNDAFVATGTAHLIAISGLHVTAFAIALMALTRVLYRVLARPGWSARWPAVQAGSVIAVAAGYGAFAGASVPTLRTVLMVALVLALRAARRGVPVTDILAAAAVALVATDPLSLSSAGFWLSFVAVAALIVLVDAGGGVVAAARTFVRAQAAVTVVLAPVLVGAFGAVSVVGPLVNAVAIPLFSFVLLPLVLAATALLPLAPGPAARLWNELGQALDGLWPMLVAVADARFASFSPPAAPAWLLLVSLFSAVAAVMVPGRALRILATIPLVALLARPADTPPPGGFGLVVLDVGHGLAAVVRTASHTLLFDTGPRWKSGGSAARMAVLPWFRQAGIDAVDLLVVSHPDNDHAGGFEVIARALRPRGVLGSLDGAAVAGTRLCLAGARWTWDGVDFEVVHPDAGTHYGRNDGSCAIRIDSPGGRALLLADPERRAERAMLERDIAAGIVLVPHHGSGSSSSPDFVAAVGAELALVSTGFGNHWGFPRAEVVGRWQAAGAGVYTTAAGGALAVSVSPDAGIGPIEQQRERTRRWWMRSWHCRGCRRHGIMPPACGRSFKPAAR